MSERDSRCGDKMSGLAKLVFVGFAIVAGYFLITEHTAHVLSALPLLLFLSCPLMHFIMHHGHKHGHHAGGSRQGTGGGTQ